MKRQGKVYGIGVVGVILINMIAWQSAEFCDWYVEHAYPIILNTYARLTSLVKFSVGEIMLILAVCITAFGIGFFIVNLLTKFKFKRALKIFGTGYAWLVLVVAYIMTCNCFISYHATPFTDKYDVSANDARFQTADASGLAGETVPQNEYIYTKENIAALRDYIVEKCNELAPLIERDENGDAVYNGNLRENARLAFMDMGEEYPQLAGYVAQPKYLTYSGFFSQQSIMGYYFPFSMEANVNNVMYITNVPFTVCHELAHTKGVIYEDDANMIGFLACINSDDVFIQYCGYLGILNYVNNDFYASINKNKTEYKEHVRISGLVSHDNIFLKEDTWEKVEEKAVVKTETVKAASQALMDTTLKANGVSEGRQQYDEVVNLLLEYYNGVLY